MRKVEILDSKIVNNKVEPFSVGKFGLFHQWGDGFVEYEEGFAQCTVAIVELEDGSIETPPPTLIRFVKEESDG